MKTYRSYSSEETRLFGDKIAKQVSGVPPSPRLRRAGRCPAFAKASAGRQVSRSKKAFILALKGDLGSGKTTFTQGFLRGLGVRARVNSPTFVLMKRFGLRGKRFKNAYHLDCYRIKKPKELLGLGLKEIFDNPENIVLVEWPERIKSILPKGARKIVFKHKKEESEREIDVYQ